MWIKGSKQNLFVLLWITFGLKDTVRDMCSKKSFFLAVLSTSASVCEILSTVKMPNPLFLKIRFFLQFWYNYPNRI